MVHPDVEAWVAGLRCRIAAVQAAIKGDRRGTATRVVDLDARGEVEQVAWSYVVPSQPDQSDEPSAELRLVTIRWRRLTGKDQRIPTDEQRGEACMGERSGGTATASPADPSAETAPGPAIGGGDGAEHSLPRVADNRARGLGHRAFAALVRLIGAGPK